MLLQITIIVVFIAALAAPHFCNWLKDNVQNPKLSSIRKV